MVEVFDFVLGVFVTVQLDEVENIFGILVFLLGLLSEKIEKM